MITQVSEDISVPQQIVFFDNDHPESNASYHETTDESDDQPSQHEEYHYEIARLDQLANKKQDAAVDDPSAIRLSLPHRTLPQENRPQ